MTQLGDAISRYHRLLESERYSDLAWVNDLQERMQARHLTVAGRPVSPVLRPHFISRRQYTGLVKASESLFSAITRIEQVTLSTPALMSRLQMLPAEKMLAHVDPGYSHLAVTSLLDTHLHNGTLRFVGYNAEAPSGVYYSEALADVFYDSPLVKEYRRKYSLSKLGGTKYLLNALLKAFKDFGGKKKPRIAILEFKQPFITTESGEYLLMAEVFNRQDFPTQVVSPDQLEYKNGVLRSGNFVIDLVYRRVKVQEFLVRFDLSHPLVRAYRDGKVCVVNSFRSEMAQKKAMFDLLTDETITSGFPAAEKRAIREFIPWTRMVTQNKTTYQEERIDLPDFILKNREKLVLRPNDESTDQQSFRGSETDDTGWEKALHQAMRNPYVVQEVVEPVREIFPLYQSGQVQMREMRVDLHPHSFLGKVQGASSWLTANGSAGFSTVAGIAPTFILEAK